MDALDLTFYNKIVNEPNSIYAKPFYYRHKTSGSLIFKCPYCDFETKYWGEKNSDCPEIMAKKTHNIKSHLLSYEHRYNEYFSKGFMPIVPEFETDKIKQTFEFFQDYISSEPDCKGSVYCNLCKVDFDTKKQLYTHLVKSNKRHLVKQVEQDNCASFTVKVSDKIYEIDVKADRHIITGEEHDVMNKYKRIEEGDFCCKHCFNFVTDDDDEFYKHLKTTSHKQMKEIDRAKENIN
jgi:hypothetical protein